MRGGTGRGCKRTGLNHQLGHQRRVPWVGCLWHTAMNSNVVAPAKCPGVGESEGCATMLKRGDVVDCEDARPTALLAAPSVPI